MTETGYIHTTTEAEQDRLIRQGVLLAPHLHKHVDLSGRSNLLEIGCGVGAQLQILFRRYPNMRMTGIDISDRQIQRARTVLRDEVSNGQLALHVGRAEELPFPDASFDAIYICFVLEHLSDPGAVIREARRVLIQGGVLYCTEVFNSALYVYPESPAIMEYWRAFNACQREMGGDPDVGIRLCNLMVESELEVQWLQDASYMLDRRMADPQERATYFDHWHANFLSAKEQLISERMITPELVAEFEREFAALRNAAEAVFLYSNRQVCAHKPRHSVS